MRAIDAGFGTSMNMSTSNLLLDQTIERSIARPKMPMTVESQASDVDFGHGSSVSPIQDKLNRTQKPIEAARDLVNKAPPAAGLHLTKKPTEPLLDKNPTEDLRF
jgi:hypothetical protein